MRFLHFVYAFVWLRRIWKISICNFWLSFSCSNVQDFPSKWILKILKEKHQQSEQKGANKQTNKNEKKNLSYQVGLHYFNFYSCCTKYLSLNVLSNASIIYVYICIKATSGWWSNVLVKHQYFKKGLAIYGAIQKTN